MGSWANGRATAFAHSAFLILVLLSRSTIKTFGIIYAGIAILTLAWGLGNYLRRLHLIKTKYAGSFDDLVGPPLICAALFIAVLLNFIVRVQQHNLEVP